MAGSAEKSQLIPVLSTILKLSPTEVDSIQKVVASDLAAGGSAGGSAGGGGSGGSAASTTSQSLAEATSEVAWTSYLGLWSNN